MVFHNNADYENNDAMVFNHAIKEFFQNMNVPPPQAQATPVPVVPVIAEEMAKPVEVKEEAVMDKLVPEAQVLTSLRKK